MIKRSILLIYLILILLLACPVNAVSIGNFTYRVYPHTVIQNASDEDRIIRIRNARDIDWNGNNTNDVMLSALIFADQNVDNKIEITLYYGAGKQVIGAINTSVAPLTWDSYREFGITLNDLGQGNNYWKSSSSYVIDIGKENFGNGSYLIGLGKPLLTDPYVVDVWKEFKANPQTLETALNPITSSDYSLSIIGYAYYEENNILNTPITRIKLHCDNANTEVYILYINKERYYETVSGANLIGGNFVVDISRTITQLTTALAFVMAGIYLFELIFITNLPWIFVALEAVGIMLIFFNSQGNIFKAIVQVWKLQEDIIDWIMYVPKFVEQHWQLSIIIVTISFIGWLVSSTALVTKFLSGPLKFIFG